MQLSSCPVAKMGNNAIRQMAAKQRFTDNVPCVLIARYELTTASTDQQNIVDEISFYHTLRSIHTISICISGFLSIKAIPQ